MHVAYLCGDCCQAAVRQLEGAAPLPIIVNENAGWAQCTMRQRPLGPRVEVPQAFSSLSRCPHPVAPLQLHEAGGRAIQALQPSPPQAVVQAAILRSAQTRMLGQ